MDISYHRLPNGPLKDIWLRNIRRENPRDRGYTYVCSAHFTPDCFEANTGLIPGFKKPTAVPTVFSFPTKYSVNKPRLSSVKQIKSKRKKGLKIKFFQILLLGILFTFYYKRNASKNLYCIIEDYYIILLHYYIIF